MTEFLQNGLVALQYASLVYLLLINLAGLFAMGADKQFARRKKRRIPEKTLFCIALIGGSLGAFFGMHLFHHKTKHWYFLFGMPFILVCQIAVLIYLSFVFA